MSQATPPPVVPAAKPVTSNSISQEEHWLLWALKGLAAILKSGLIGGKELSEVIGVEGVVAFRSFGAMSIRLGDVGFGWIALTGMSIIFVAKDNLAAGIASVIASLMIGTGTFALMSTMWDIALGRSGKSIPRGLRWLIGILALPVNILDSVMDSLAAPVITGAFLVLANVPFSEWESVIEKNPVLFGITGILATLFFIFSFFGELITKIIEMEGQQVIAETSQPAKVEEKNEEEQEPAPTTDDPRFPEEFHIKFDANVHKAVTPPNAADRRVIFAKDAQPGARPLGWCFATELPQTSPATQPKKSAPPAS